MRRLLFAALALAFLGLIVLRRAEFGSMTTALAAAKPLGILAAALCECGALVALASLYRAALRAAGVPARFGETLNSILGSLFVSLMVPSAGLAGMALFISELGKRGHPEGRVSAGFLIAAACDLVALAGVTLAAACWARSQHAPWAFLAAGILLAAGLALAAVVTIARWAPERLTRVLGHIARARDRFAPARGPGRVLPDEWAARATASARAAVIALFEHPGRFPRMVLLALVYHLAAAMCLGLLIAAFGAEPRLDRVLAGYALATATWILSPVPQGIGAVEGVLALVLSGFGVPLASSTWIALTFRALTFWMPLGLGILALQRLRLFRHT